MTAGKYLETNMSHLGNKVDVRMNEHDNTVGIGTFVSFSVLQVVAPLEFRLCKVEEGGTGDHLSADCDSSGAR